MSLNKREERLLNNFYNSLKNKLGNAKDDSVFNNLVYLYDAINLIDTKEELKYFICFLSKVEGLVDVDEYIYDEDKQKKFEAIMHSAMKLYDNEKCTTSRINKAYDRFVSDVENTNISTIRELKSIKDEALINIGYDEINEDNALDVFREIAKIKKKSR